MGEIHLDHVGVTYQKNDFERDTREWLDAVRFIRGEGPMQPRKARDLQYDENQLTLARMFSGFRRNDAGVKCLIPGDGDNSPRKSPAVGAGLPQRAARVRDGRHLVRQRRRT